MRSLNPDTDSRTTKTGKEGFTLKANQKEENLNGCAALTKTESEGIDTDIEALESYICNNICQYREKTTNQEALEFYFCSSCEMSKHISKIKAEYDEINSFAQSEAWKLLKKYRRIVLCKDCIYRAHEETGLDWCRLARGLDESLEEDEGCSRGKERE
mgnify:FL=1